MERFLAGFYEKAQNNLQRIVFPEGTEQRVVKAAEIIRSRKLAIPILLGNPDDVRKIALELGANIEGIAIIDPLHSEKLDIYAARFYELRKHKGITPEQARETVIKPTYFGTMMVNEGDADGFISGSTHSTADTIRPALQIFKKKEKFHKVSSFFLMFLEDRLMIFADCAVIIDPDAKDLADIAVDTAHVARKFNLEPKIAMLSFSTHGSAKHPMVEKVQEATAIAQSKLPGVIIDGDIQLDAAIIPAVAQIKCPDSSLKGEANVLIFPDLQSGNICYKIVERLARAKAIGPIMNGIAKPVNDLSRGCNVQDIVNLTVITAVEAQEKNE